MRYVSPEGWSVDSDSWSVNTLIRMYNRGEIDFDSKVQRDYVWTKKISSKYIQSLLWGMLVYNMPHLYSKHGNIYYSIDGQQRALTLIKYVNNEFALVGLENYPIIIDGVSHNINRKKFEHLSPKMQEKILDYQISVAVLEDATDQIEAEFFQRANSGVVVSKKDVFFAKSVSKNAVLKLCEHPIFDVIFPRRENQLSPRKEIVIKTYIALNETVADYSQKHYAEIMATDFEEDDVETIKTAYDKVLAAYKYVLLNNSVIATMILKKTHLLAYIGYIDMFSDAKNCAEWLLKFYGDMPDEYVEACSNGTTKTKNIAIRVSAVGKSVRDFVSSL